MEGRSEDEAIRYKTLREMLLRKRAEIKERIEEELGEKMTEDIDSVLGPALDEGDLSTLEIGRDVDYQLLSMYTRNLKNINQALERLDEGTYGICEECGREIGEKRLQVMPFALYCVQCQREKEKLKETDRGRIWMERRVQIEQNQDVEGEYPEDE
jgi:DnaK suppressor protein